MFTGSKSLAVRGRELKWRIPNDAKRIFMELSRRDFLKVVSGISIFKALGSGKGQ
jgi:hypothetical protein